MEEETNNSELLINTEPQTTEQPTNPQPPTQPNPEPKQEATEPQKQEETKMSEIDLSKLSLEELQAAIEKKKAEEAKPKFELDENDPSNLAKFLQGQFLLPLLNNLNAYAMSRTIAKYPGKLTKFAFMKTREGAATNNKHEVTEIHIVSVNGEYVVDKYISDTYDGFDEILKKI